MNAPFFAPVSVVVIVLAALAGSARATPEFPDEIQAHLAADALPACQVCHTDGGSSGTAQQPFALAMKEEGLAPSDVDSLTAALDALEAAAVDSDGDGDSDIDELRVGRNPNVDDAGGGAGEPPPQLRYGFGCGASGDAGLAPALLGLLVAARARRSRNRPGAKESVLTSARTSANTQCS